MTSQPHPFKYDALPSPSSIRLVTILAPDNDDADMDKRPAISCRLETGDLSDAPAYDALSYAWGSPFWRGDGGEELNEYSVDNYCPITVNGCERWITKNLFEGLLRLRHHLFDAKEKEAYEGDGGLWFQCEVVGDVDQRLQPLDKTPLIQAAEIGSDCELKNIKNRTPLECSVEKVAQVEMMKRINASAQSTIVWLGVEDQGTKLALQALDILLNYYHIVGLIGPERMIKQRFQHLDSLIKRTWFQRVWVIQEILLARKITVLCGKYVLPWEAICLRARNLLLLTDFPDGGLEYIIDTKSSAFCFELGTMGPGLDLFHVALEKKCSLSTLLSLTEGFSAKDPRDKSFDLLSLARENASGNSATVDCHTPPRDFYVSMEYDLMSCKGIFSKEDAEMDGAFTEVLEGLSFHCWVPRSVENPLSLPSWVPDFRHIWCAPVKRVLNEQWTACTSIPAQIRNLPQKGRLGLGGFKVDEIEAVAPRLSHPACWHGNFYYTLSRSNCQCPAKWKKTLPPWLQFASSLNSSFPTGELFLEVLWHILLGEDDGVERVESEAQNEET
ncbi:hypothetical protein IWZ03DRAFT_360683 [Phyllosticta citriasiana]|uniref:Heterokaryon incompatibility domain-containing protein n=1 Tax=Phyllosticta citriasiana TaxID=595635 RepID=A0ABR1KIE8_9PEZI